MTDKGEIRKNWEKTQLNWTDKDFLEHEANALMKQRWKRLNLIIGRITASEVARAAEYINFLDVGAGRGEFYKYISGIVKNYTGIEPSDSMLPYEIKEDGFEMLKGSGETIDYEEKYDVCLIKEALDHCYDPMLVISNCGRALKKNGLLIITLTNKESYYKLLFKKKAEELEKKHTDHLYNFAPRDVVKMTKEAGFVSERVISYNYLRMPRMLEEIFGSLPQKFVHAVLDITDTVGSMLLKEKGGSFIILARKP